MVYKQFEIFASWLSQEFRENKKNKGPQIKSPNEMHKLVLNSNITIKKTR